MENRKKIRNFLESLLRNSPRPAGELRSMTCRDFYACLPGGGGAGRGEPVVAETLRPGGGGAGRGEPVVAETRKPGGGGAGRGEPVVAETLRPGGGGAGRGEPVRRETETAEARLLDKCLTELTTGSTIKTAKASNARRIEMFFFMAKSLLTVTMKEIRKS
jgi:hypothetical protein